jgi:hypothetical protein
VGDDDDTAEDKKQRPCNCGGGASRKAIEHSTSDSSDRSARGRTADEAAKGCELDALGQCSGMTPAEVVGGDGHWRVKDKTQPRQPTRTRPRRCDLAGRVTYRST